MQPEQTPPPRRRKHHDEDDHTPHLAHDESNWLVSYADMMTLLFGFFVLMYAFSKIDKDKFQVVSKDVVKYFGGKLPDNPGAPVGPNELKDLKNSVQEEVAKGLAADLKAELQRIGDPALQESAKGTESAAKAVGKTAPEFTVDVQGNRLIFTLGSDLLFAPGSAQPSPLAEEVVQKVVTAIGKRPVESIEVEGHTDADPIATAQFPSNWELSAARASSVVRMLEQLSVDPEKLRVTGLGSSRPPDAIEGVDDEEEVQFKKRSRRVVLSVTVGQESSDLKEAISGNGLEVKPPTERETSAASGAAAAAPTAVPAPAAGAAPATEDTALKAKYEEMNRKFAEANRRLKEAQEKQKKAKELEALRVKTQDMEKKLMELEQKTKETLGNAPGREPTEEKH